MFCTKCGCQIKDGYKFCPKCGAPAYVEQEEPKGEVKKEEVDEVTKEANASVDSEPEDKSSEKVKKTTKEKTAFKTQKEISESTHNNSIPLILEELDIDGVKKKAEQGDKEAMLRQAFRYEVGIGVDKDLKKAEELYNKVGGKNSLFSLENSNANCILPDSYYGLAVPNDKEKTNNGFYFKSLPFVKDLIVDYANKVNDAKTKGDVSKEELVKYRNEFISNILLLRDRYPEFLFVNYDEDLSKEKATQIFEVIKKNASNRFALSWLPSLFSFSDYVGGNRIEIPNIFYMNYHPDENKMVYCEESDDIDLVDFNKSVILQIMFNIMLQIPIKKSHFTFLCESYEDIGLFLNNIDSSLYDILCSDEEIESFSKRLEKRNREVIKKYGVYQEYCEKNREIPVPYEFVVDLGCGLCEYNFGKATGVYYIDYTKMSRHRSYYKKWILNNQKNELYTDNPIFYGKYLIQDGFFMGNYNFQLPFPPFPPDSYGSIEEKINSEALTFKDWIYCDDVSTRVAEGEGEYEVVLQVGPHPESKKLSFETFNYEEILGVTFYNFEKLVGYNQFAAEDCTSNTRFNSGSIVLKAFPTEKEAMSYVNDKNTQRIKPKIIKSVSQRIRLVPYIIQSEPNTIGIALYVPSYVILKQEYKDDLMFYFGEIGISKSVSEELIEFISIGYHGLVLKKIEKVESYLSYDYYTITNNSIAIIDDDKLGGKGFFFPDIVNNKYQIETNIWGVQKNYREVYELCLSDIGKIEKELVSRAHKKWGEDFAYSHLVFSDDPLDVCRLVVRKVKHFKLPVMRYDNQKYEGIINCTPITENKVLLEACIDYINREIHAKEEMKVQKLDIGSAAESKYETDLSTMIIPVGKAESKDADFRMDLVSHVHSFIIGQSGSGKSVFLHNIIGGAMLKYAPEDLQLYLLDFKLGGVEFNRYQGAKHVKALLVDNSDPQVTLEILRELRGSMTERGKLLRSAGVNNIGEYNKLHQQDRMPHVLLVADECHEMFKADDSIPRQVRNEISDIVIKIAKEGRSQGVHLVFATQTLSGTEISSEIINNVSDFYLLKCAQTDSERLVPNSSAITSELSTGQIYYHHVDEQVKFQAYYTDKEDAEKLMAAIVEKAKDHKSNGEFYFNGAQMFYLDESVKEQMLEVKGKSPVAFMGKAIDICQKDLYIKLNEDFSENVLLLGLNDQEQVTRTTMNLFVSLMISAKLKHKDIAFKVIDCLNNEEGEVHESLFDLENEGYCEIIERRQRSKFFKELAQGVQGGTAEETILLILGQDRFRELKMDMELEESNSSKPSDEDDMMSISDNFFGSDSSSSSSVRTYREALNVILEKGPDYGVHTLLQIEKASNLLFEDYITPKMVFQKFKHLVMLKSDETAGVTLHLNDDIRLEKLSSDWERLRAYYYAEESDSYTLFTPYMPSKSKDIINLLNTI